MHALSARPGLLIFETASVLLFCVVLTRVTRGSSRAVYGAILIACAMGTVAWVAFGLPFWAILSILLVLEAAVMAVRAVADGGRRRASAILGGVCLLSTPALWILSGAPHWRIVTAIAAIAVAALVLYLVRQRKEVHAVRVDLKRYANDIQSAARPKYLYWSQRRVSHVTEDRGIHLPKPSEYNLGANIGAINVGKKVQSGNGSSRHDVAETLVDRLSPARLDAGAAGPEQGMPFTVGTGTIAFSEFRGDEKLGMERLAIGYAAFNTSDGKSVALCLFCSLDNFVEFIQSSDSGVKRGWSWSSSPAVLEFIRTSGATKGIYSPNEIAIECVKHALDRRDVKDSDAGHWKRRPFTFLEVQGEAEWLAEVYHDAVFDSTVEIGGVASSPDLKFDRIVVGAPLWIRTRKMRAVRLSDEYTEAELDEEFNRAAMLKRRAQLVLTELGLLATPPPPESQAQRPRY